MAENRIRLKQLFTGILIVLWCLLIGSFSAQNGSESGGLSARVADQVITIEEHVKKQTYSEKEKEAKVTALQFPIRKTAHMSEYGLLAMLLVWHLGYYGVFRRNQVPSKVQPSIGKRLFLAWLLAVIYAATDEIHQLFVPGRGGQLTDVCIDAFGAFLGVLFFWLCRKLWLKLLKRLKRKFIPGS